MITRHEVIRGGGGKMEFMPPQDLVQMAPQYITQKWSKSKWKMTGTTDSAIACFANPFDFSPVSHEPANSFNQELVYDIFIAIDFQKLISINELDRKLIFESWFSTF